MDLRRHPLVVGAWRALGSLAHAAGRSVGRVKVLSARQRRPFMVPVLVALAAPLIAPQAPVSLSGGSSSQSVLSTSAQVKVVELPLPRQTSTTFASQAWTFALKLEQGFGIGLHPATEFSGWIIEASERQQLQPELLASLVLAESSFRKYVRSHVGAVGPAQIRPGYWANFCGQQDLQDPEQNIYCGAQILGYLVERCEGDMGCALAAYNVGLHSKRRAAAQRYLAKIDRHMEALSASL